MNIIHVIASPSPGGIETFVKDLAIETAESGWSVHICFLESASEAGTSQEFENEYIAELKSAGIKYFFIGRDARSLIWRGIKIMSKYVRENSINIYHSHLTYGIIFGAFVRVPRVYTHHSINMRVGRLNFALISCFIDQLVGISDSCTRTLSRHAARRVVTIFNGIDLKRMSPHRLAVREIEDDLNCVSVGRICVEKNYGLLIDAISRLSVKIRSRLSVRIAGAGSVAMTADLREHISRMGLEDVVSLLGSRNDVPELLASSHMFLMSSSSEGLPIALIEAAASGLPCVVTDVGGCREVVEECRNGVLVEPDNAEALACAIAEIIGDKERFTAFSVNALKFSRAFSIESAATSHIALYRRLVLSAQHEAP